MPEVSARAASPVKTNHTTAVTMEMAMTTGTKTPATRSANLAMGALDDAASSTRAIIWASVVSSPTRVALNTKEPEVLIEAAATLSPGILSTGMDSPVRADSSTAEPPSTTSPSTGIVWPGRTTMRSPTATSSTGMVNSSAPLRTMAVLGARSISREMASPVLPLDRVSRYLPRVMRVRMVPAPSK